MAIRFKGKNDLKITKQQVVTGLLAWLIFSYIFYAFFYILREAFRILTAIGSAVGYQPLMVLSDVELFFYNLFYAAIALAVGYMFALRLVLQSVSRSQPRKTRYFIRNTLNDQGFITWSFLFWFSKLGGLLGICFLMVYLQYDLNFIVDYPLLLVLLPLVIFLGTWPSFSRLIRARTFRWFGMSMGIFISMSFIFSQKNFIDVDKVNHGLLKNNIDYAYSLDLPRSQSHEEVFKKSLVTEVYVVMDSANKPLIFFESTKRPVNLDGLDWEIRAEKDKLSMYEQDRWMPVLFIDSNIPMSYIKDLKYAFRKSEVRKVMYSTGMKFSKYPSTYPLLRLSGITQVLGPEYYPEFESFLDSAERMDRIKYTLKLSESMMYRINWFDTVNRIEVSSSRSGVKVNGQTVNESKLEEVVYAFFKRLAPDAIVFYSVDNDVPYGRYIEILDVLKWQIDKLHDELSFELYDEPFEHWDSRAKKSIIYARYPRAIVEWTREEERLLELMK